MYKQAQNIYSIKHSKKIVDFVDIKTIFTIYDK